MTTHATKFVVVATRLDDKDYEDLKRILSRTGLSCSGVLRLALKQWTLTAKKNGFDVPEVPDREAQR